MIKISTNAAVNPKHVVAVMFDKTSLKTKVVLLGMQTLDSDHSFYDTVVILNKGIVHDNEREG